MNELKPCPFCGCKDVVMDRDFETDTYAVRCGGCQAVVWQYYAVKDEAEAAWNRREGAGMTEWISVKDRLPTDERRVLAYYGFGKKDGSLGSMFMSSSEYYAFDPAPHWQHVDIGLTVTHWMPLPDPPKEAAHDDHP